MKHIFGLLVICTFLAGAALADSINLDFNGNISSLNGFEDYRNCQRLQTSRAMPKNLNSNSSFKHLPETHLAASQCSSNNNL